MMKLIKGSPEFRQAILSFNSILNTDVNCMKLMMLSDTDPSLENEVETVMGKLLIGYLVPF